MTTVAWPPTNYPFPNGGPNPRTSATVMAPYHYDDHNDTNNAINSLVNQIDVYDRLAVNASGSGLIPIDLNKARYHSVLMTGNVTGFDIQNFVVLPESGEGLYIGANAFTLILNTGTSGGFTATWDLQINGGGTAISWPNGAPPSLNMLANKVHVLSFHWMVYGWFGYVNAEEMG